MHAFVLNVKTFGLDACFLEVVQSSDEAFSVGSVGGEWKVLFTGYGSGGGILFALRTSN